MMIFVFLDVPGKVLSLEELEARMRKGNEMPQIGNRNKQDEDMSAFKKLVSLFLRCCCRFISFHIKVVKFKFSATLSHKEINQLYPSTTC